MKAILSSILLLLVFILSNACSVDKRLHNPGYHVEWKNSKIPTSVKNYSNQKLASNCENLVVDSQKEIREEEELKREEIPFSKDITKDLFRENREKVNSKKANTLEKKPKIEIELVEGNSKTLVNKQEKSKLPVFKDNKKNDKEINRLAIIGLALVLSSLLLFFTIIPGMYLSAVALRQMKHAPDRYDSKGLALTGLILSYCLLGVLVLFILFFAFAFGSVQLLFTIYLLSAYLFLIVSTQVIINT